MPSFNVRRLQFGREPEVRTFRWERSGRTFPHETCGSTNRPPSLCVNFFKLRILIFRRLSSQDRVGLIAFLSIRSASRVSCNDCFSARGRSPSIALVFCFPPQVRARLPVSVESQVLSYLQGAWTGRWIKSISCIQARESGHLRPLFGCL